MENIALNVVLPLLQSNTATGAIAANTFAQLHNRVYAERFNIAGLAMDTLSAGVLGLATLALPEIGIHTSPELALYAAMIGFNLPTIISVARGEQRLWDTSMAMGVGGLIMGGFTDALQFAAHIPLNANHLIKSMSATLSGIGNIKILQ